MIINNTIDNRINNSLVVLCLTLLIVLISILNSQNSNILSRLFFYARQFWENQISSKTKNIDS